MLGIHSRKKAARGDLGHVTRLDIGCGSAKKDGYFGLDMDPEVKPDLLLDVASDPWPFRNDCIEYIYSNHAFEHISGPDYKQVRREMMRVCKHEAQVEIWTPYGLSRDAFINGHRMMLNENQWKHFCYEHDRVWFRGAGYLLWEESEYNLNEGVLEELRAMNINFKFGLARMFDIAKEWCVRLQVRKDAIAPRVPSHQCDSSPTGGGTLSSD